MFSDCLISIEGVEKSFEIFDKPHHRLLSLFARDESHWRAKRFDALRGVSFKVHRGEAVGIIGRNGSGKSTLLQIVCGTLQPTRGKVEVSGRVAALLELGAGFNPEFSGRENVYLNGSLLGMPRAEVDAAFASILDFAEIGEHIDQPVKTYSSGMYVRLAFAVAVHSNPEVLIVDEALSVGDVYFQRKCYRRIEELRTSGCTLLLVTHSMDSLLQICDRGVLLEEGQMIFDGDCKEAAGAYMRCLFGSVLQQETNEILAEDVQVGESSDLPHDPRTFLLRGGRSDLYSTRPGYNRDETRLGNRSIVLSDFVIESASGWGPALQARQPFAIHARYCARESVDRLVFGLQIRTVDGLVAYSTNTFVSHNRLMSIAVDETRLVRFDLRCTLLPGQYFLTLGVSRFEEGGEEIIAIDRRMDSVILTVFGDNNHTNGLVDMEARISFDETSEAAA
jgi:lipopolysaccharide transport system ATP-binding protein